MGGEREREIIIKKSQAEAKKRNKWRIQSF